MQINLHKAYDYYIANIERSCRTTAPLTLQDFNQAFLRWIENLQMQETFDGGEFNNNFKIQTNCGNWKFVSLQRTLNKLQ